MKLKIYKKSEKRRQVSSAVFPSISILLGSGFSAPMGYPTAKGVGETLVDIAQGKSGQNMDIDLCGKLIKTNNTHSFPYSRSEYSRQFCFCKELISLYSEENKGFNYENFYDFINSKEILNLPKYLAFFRKFVGDSIDDPRELKRQFEQYLFNANSIIQQMVADTIHDKTGERWYDESVCHETVEKYDGFLQKLHEWSQNYTINVHTLNHDLLFESFNKTMLLSGLISDGFEEQGSPFYGKLNRDNVEYNVRLARFTGNFKTPIRLYKLHGSLNYARYCRPNKNLLWEPSHIVKIRKYIPYESIFYYNIETNSDEHNFETILPDFLAGTTSKTFKYNDSLIYKPNLDAFKKNLQEAELLLIVGYGGNDSGINEILDVYDYKTKRVYIIDQAPQDNLIQLAQKMNAILINKSIEFFEPNWIQ